MQDRRRRPADRGRQTVRHHRTVGSGECGTDRTALQDLGGGLTVSVRPAGAASEPSVMSRAADTTASTATSCGDTQGESDVSGPNHTRIPAQCLDPWRNGYIIGEMVITISSES